MNDFRNTGFADRLNAAESAKKAMVARFRAQPGPDDPAFVERQAARLAAAVARDARAAERKAARESERAAAIEATRAAKAAAEEERITREADAARAAAEESARALTLEAERKAARDARYAARKARQR